MVKIEPLRFRIMLTRSSYPKFCSVSVSERPLADVGASTSERRLAKPVGRRGVATAAERRGATAAAAAAAPAAAAAAAHQGQHAQEAARIKHPLPIQGPRSQEYVRGKSVFSSPTQLIIISLSVPPLLQQLVDRWRVWKGRPLSPSLLSVGPSTAMFAVAVVVFPPPSFIRWNGGGGLWVSLMRHTKSLGLANRLVANSFLGPYVKFWQF